MKAALITTSWDKKLARHVNVLLSAAKAEDIDGCDLIVLGPEAEISLMKRASCDRVILCKSAALNPNSFCAEPILEILSELHKKYAYGLFLFMNDLLGNELAVRLGFRLQGSALTNACRVCVKGNSVVAERGVFGQNLKARFGLIKGPFSLSVSETDCPERDEAGSPEIIVENWDLDEPQWFYDAKMESATQKDPFENARIVVAGGRGVQGKPGMELLRKLADLLGGELGGSRPAVLDGWLGQDRIIGISGKTIRPDLCLVFGASGLMPFAAGIEDSKRIVAVNTDTNALIFKTSDVGVVSDFKPIAEALIRQIEKENDR